MRIFLKLGGSLITDKSRRASFRPEVVTRLGREIAAACGEADLVIGHGSGSFGHYPAAAYGTAAGVHTPDQWHGFAEVAAEAARLNRLVTDALRGAGLPVLSVQPSASARCVDGRLVSMATAPVEAALARGLMPLVYGDVCFDDVRGGTIISTEDILFYLAERLRPDRVLLAGADAGVYAGKAKTVIPHIDRATLARLEREGVLGGRPGADVTGGMRGKVRRMLALAEALPGVEIRIFSGAEPGAVARALRGQGDGMGTMIRNIVK